MRTTTAGPLVRLFGGTTVLVDGVTLDAPHGKPATAFAALALAGGAVVRTPELIDAMWGDRPPQSARALVHTHLSVLRHALTAGSAAAPLPETVPNGYRLALTAEQVDVLRFLRLSVDDGTDEDIAEALRASAGPVLAGCDTEFAESWRLRVSAQRTLLQHQVWSRRVRNGDSAGVLPDVRAAVAADPLWEGGVLLLVRALDDTGRREEALSTLDRYRRQLANDLGLDPSPAVAQEQRRLLRGTRPDPRPPAGERAPAPPPGPDAPPSHDDGQHTRSSQQRTRRAVLGGVVLVGAVAVGTMWRWTTQPTSPPEALDGPALLFHDRRSGRLRETVQLPIRPDVVELDAGRLWVGSLTDRAVAYGQASDPAPMRVVGLPQPPTTLASSSGTATVGLGFSGQLVTIGEGRAGPPWTLPTGDEGRLTLAAGRDGLWAATIDGKLFGPDLTAPSTAPLDVPGTPFRMAMGPGRAWVLTLDRRQLVAVPLSGGRPLASALRGVPVDIGAADDGAWAVTSGDDRLWHAPAAQGRVVATRPLPGPPAGVAVQPGVVWVAVKQPPLLIGYDSGTLQPVSTVGLDRPPVDLTAEGDLLVVAVA